MKLRNSDTIVAIATPVGTGAISIVRMSGPDAIAIAEKTFRGANMLSTTPGYTIRHGRIVDKDSETIDEVLVSVFRSPGSYTGEDSVEINCHGGMYVTKKVLLTLMEAGARQADPGEFTRRAFLNGKMDLSQAEAVSDVISAGSKRSLRNSTAQLGGTLAHRMHQIKTELVRICSLLELELDFSQDGEQLVTPEEILRFINVCTKDVRAAIDSFRFGKVLRDGIGLAIVGRPNVGKSSIFNRLLQEDRSIVSPTPGTTRDFLEEGVSLDGLSVRLFDTAGLRISGDDVEAEGIARTVSVMKLADIVLLVLDATLENTHTGDMNEIMNTLGNESSVIVAVNKVDLVPGRTIGPKEALRISALTGEGMDLLKKSISTRLGGEDSPSVNTDVHLTSYRQVEALQRCLEHMEEAAGAVRSGMSGEFTAADLRLAIDAIAEVTGEVTTDEILDQIFSKFCIGK